MTLSELSSAVGLSSVIKKIDGQSTLDKNKSVTFIRYISCLSGKK